MNKDLMCTMMAVKNQVNKKKKKISGLKYTVHTDSDLDTFVSFLINVIRRVLMVSPPFKCGFEKVISSPSLLITDNEMSPNPCSPAI